MLLVEASGTEEPSQDFRPAGQECCATFRTAWIALADCCLKPVKIKLLIHVLAFEYLEDIIRQCLTTMALG